MNRWSVRYAADMRRRNSSVQKARSQHGSAFSRSHNGEENGQAPWSDDKHLGAGCCSYTTRTQNPFYWVCTRWHFWVYGLEALVAVVFCWVEMGDRRWLSFKSAAAWCHSQMHSRMHGLIIVLFWFCLNSHWYLPYFHHYPLVAEIQKYMENRSYRLPRVGYLEDHPRTRKLLATMVIGFVPNAAVGPLPNARTLWLRKWGPILTTWSWVIKPSNHHCPVFFKP